MKILLFVLLLLTTCSRKVEYTEPVIGMDYVDFVLLCGIDAGDKKESIETADKYRITVNLYSTPEREKKRCSGTMVFEEKLISITR